MVIIVIIIIIVTTVTMVFSILVIVKAIQGLLKIGNIFEVKFEQKC
jgi:hypothetical protein